ncbi:MAG: hypothetical protein ACRELC_12685, partial [Gemmatimonadota bacterium]
MASRTGISGTRRIGAFAALLAALAVGVAGCGGEPEPVDEEAAVDRELDLALEEGEAEPELR